MNLENENKKLKEKIIKNQFKALENKFESANELNKEINRTQTEMFIANQNKPSQATPINITIHNENKNNNTTDGTKIPIIATGKFKMPGGMYCLFICINIVLPGIGTMIAACLYGSDTDRIELEK